MTQPERPERADIPESNSSTSHEAVEPVDLGQRRRRRDFVPEKPSSVSPNVLAPTDRSSVRTIQEQIDAITARQPYEEVEEDNSSEFLGEPTIPGEKGFPIKRTIAGGLGALAITAAGFFGLNKINSEDNGNERPGVIMTDPTLEPSTPPPTFTPEPTLESTPTKEPEKSPYEFGFSEKVGNVTVQITKETQERTECPDPESPPQFAKPVPCNPTHEIVVNREAFPDAEERVEKVFQQSIYFAWQRAEQGRENVTFEEYIERASKGEDMSIKARGFQGSSFLPTEITIRPTDKFFYDTIHAPVSIIRPWTTLGVGYREVENDKGENEFHLEIFDFTAGGAGNKDHPEIAQYGSGNLMAVGLTYLSFPEIQKAGIIKDSAQNELTGAVVIPLREIILKRINNMPVAIFGSR